MVHVVARIPDPYGLETQRSAPLAVGLFVEATIKGEIVEGAFVLPRDALRDALASHPVTVPLSLDHLRVAVYHDPTLPPGATRTIDPLALVAPGAADDL